MLERKRWRELVAKEEWFHLARFRFGRDRISAHHTHDFPEIFWVEHGTATHHINGSTKRLDAGDIVFVRPRDQHHLSAVDAEGFVLVNLAFARSVLMDFRRRHVAATRRFHNETAVLPARVQLSRAQLSELTEELARLASASDRGRLSLERFLLGVYLLIGQPRPTDSTPRPGWLAVALERIQDRDFFAEGARGLVRASGRSAEHVARTVREHLGCTPSDYVNRVRMNHAARELRLGARNIADIAADCGIGDLAHFYALFRAAFNTTPKRYRLEHHRQIT